MQNPAGQIPPIGTHSTADDIAAWIAAPPVLALVRAFAETAQDTALAGDLELEAGPVAQRLERLDVFSRRWDTRQGRERHQAADLDLSPAQEQLTLASAAPLGMRGNSPLHFGSYDHLLILGGTIWGCLVRTARAAALLRSGPEVTGSVTALGGHRPFSGNEFALAAAAGVPQLDEEYEALDHSTRTALGLGDPLRTEGEKSPLPGGTWGVRHYRTTEGLTVRVAAAPSGEPASRRADTADTYAFFARHLTRLRPGQRLLIVTSSINVPAQHAAAVLELALPYGVDVDTVGHEPRDVPAPLERPYSATAYLREFRSTVRALRRLTASRCLRSS
ncbi:hypothetical protein ACIHCV_28530 [Streptomyces sp. NPDC051956]|uniref:hypothetical protein n=1 Tax=Streptomyces sp. NPDC051956 TaxID=3365677 RepID=UPI0037D5EB4C